MLMRIITLLFIVGIIYRFVMRYILPAFHLHSFNDDRSRQGQNNNWNNQQGPKKNTPKAKVKKEGDYIDYEEIR